MEGHHHRSSLKQSNKPFKSKHATKNSLNAKGKAEIKESLKTVPFSNAAKNKADRKNHAKLLQRKKKDQLLASNRLFSGSNGVPKIIVNTIVHAVVPLCPDFSFDNVLSPIFSSVNMEYTPQPGPILLNITERFKQKLQFIKLSRNIFDILDAVKICDMVLFVMSANVEVDKFGDLCIATIKSQGVPSIFHVVQYLENEKEVAGVKGSLASFMECHFSGKQSVLSSENSQDNVNLLRQMTTERPKPVHWRDRYSYLLAEGLEFTPNQENSEVGTLSVRGYVRGKHFSPNRLVHLPNLGDFQIRQISTFAAPSVSHNSMDEDEQVFVPQVEKQETLVTENIPDPLDAEQTWPTEEEIAAGDERAKLMKDEMETESVASSKKQKKKLVPKGTSAYQAAWLIDSEPEDEDDEDGEEEEYESPWPAVVPEKDDDEEEEEMEELVEESVAGGSILHADLDEDEEMRQYEEYKKRQQAEREDAEFPDEVDTPKDIMAKTRFQKYRGLKSFKKSPWDPYENLPIEYARIFQFQNFQRSKKRVMSNLHEGVSPGTYVIVQIDNVATGSYESIPTRPFIVFSILPYEQKTSLLNLAIQRPQPTAPSSQTIHDANESYTYTGLVKSKDPVILCCGFRRYVVNPVYSTHNHAPNGVHKMERFLRMGQSCVASVYGPIQFGPAPVLIMKFNTEGEKTSEPMLIATGSLLDLDVKRIIARRIILTGHPFKIHRRSAVVRYMFFNPEDVAYFKPVQLVTKQGLVGHIRESVGTHGYMKCVFDRPLTQQDTVCMHLYKRVYPKWTTELYQESKHGVLEWAGNGEKDDAMEL
ncbi:hypothetical protein HK098_002256 [Nowakowskiella sp. JEL0407]|nr:hypothetical protein HK098_002256 [Nowakowskiella sp. JEL0407]